MKINVNDIAKVQSALDAVNGRAEMHTLNAIAVRNVTKSFDEDLLGRGATKASLKGAVVMYQPEGPGKAYARRGRYIISTRVKLERGARGWFMTACERVEEYADNRGVQTYILSDAAVDQIVARAMDGIIRRKSTQSTEVENVG